MEYSLILFKNYLPNCEECTNAGRNEPNNVHQWHIFCFLDYKRGTKLSHDNANWVTHSFDQEQINYRTDTYNALRFKMFWMGRSVSQKLN